MKVFMEWLRVSGLVCLSTSVRLSACIYVSLSLSLCVCTARATGLHARTCALTGVYQLTKVGVRREEQDEVVERDWADQIQQEPWSQVASGDLVRFQYDLVGEIVGNDSWQSFNKNEIQNNNDKMHSSVSALLGFRWEGCGVVLESPTPPQSTRPSLTRDLKRRPRPVPWS